MLYPWQESLWQNWQQLLDQRRLHHAVLLVAPLGSGREALAKQLAQTVLCQNGVTEPCGICHSCKLFEAGTHPDFHPLAPEQQGKQIGVDAVRKCNRWAVETSQLGGDRIIMIDYADAMGEAAANALLKTLEEPPSGCQFILLASALDNLLPTINSRCNKWRLAMPNEADTQRWVEKQLMQSIKLETVRLNNSAPIATMQFIEQGQDIRYGKLLEAFAAFLQPPHIGLYDVAGLCSSEGHNSLKWLSYFMVDCLKLQQGAAGHLVHSESLPLVQQAAAVVTPATLISQSRKANALYQQLERHTGLNAELLLVEWLTGFMAQ
ncbi:DNA polymerase III subunit delta' [Photobacterium sanctipauli]|uniref:DNA polymerase III subunit delta' n=1 Tax=Photobacterium sanctipauli TaxID=1342794 RepID=A0A2T3NN69_9GAMM|nr:DNA polymerase III subunit delta' [Photobacterium sanctipauli]PSW16965.1 DNA polymerase III subunit delta' [Photobacterium sanctipauli]